MLPAAPEQAPEQTSTMLFWYWLYRGMAHFTCGEYAAAQAELEQAGWFAWSAPGHIHLLDYHLYSAPVAFQTADAGDLLGESPSQHSRPLRQNRPLGAD
ncbi:PAS sensor protein [Enterobacter cloacae]|uniref:PAS sensor protein n=1 Tax=Enterobacter cloacae TaxID=550 RepID=A0A377M8C5_ENTCL|nr:PAS sensor protein [Enterobacter cloacae]